MDVLVHGKVSEPTATSQQQVFVKAVELLLKELPLRVYNPVFIYSVSTVPLFGLKLSEHCGS